MSFSFASSLADCFWDWTRCTKQFTPSNSINQYCIKRFKMCIDVIVSVKDGGDKFTHFSNIVRSTIPTSAAFIQRNSTRSKLFSNNGKTSQTKKFTKPITNTFEKASSTPSTYFYDNVNVYSTISALNLRNISTPKKDLIQSTSLYNDIETYSNKSSKNLNKNTFKENSRIITSFHPNTIETYTTSQSTFPSYPSYQSTSTKTKIISQNTNIPASTTTAANSFINYETSKNILANPPKYDNVHIIAVG